MASLLLQQRHCSTVGKPATGSHASSLLTTTRSRGEDGNQRRTRGEADPKRDQNRSKKERNKINCHLCVFLLFAGDGDSHRRQGREEEKKLSKTRSFSRIFAAAREPTCRQWWWRVEETCRHCSYRSRRFPSTVMDFWGSVL